MRIQRSKPSNADETDERVRVLSAVPRWPFKGLIIGAATLGLAAGLAACSDDSSGDPLPLTDDDSGVIVEDPPGGAVVGDGEMEEGG